MPDGQREERRYRPAQVRLYIDADMLGLAKLLVQIRNDVTYPGDPGGVVHKRRRAACSITPATLDVDWLPQVATRGWLIVTRDRNIQDHRAEIGAVRDDSARMVTLHGPEARGTWSSWRSL